MCFTFTALIVDSAGIMVELTGPAWLSAPFLTAVPLGYNLETGFMAGCSVTWHEQGVPNVLPSAPEAWDVHLTAHSESSVVEFSSVSFSDLECGWRKLC